MQVLSRQRGVSLIEVLMAVLIFSIGLIGLAGLMVMSTRSNHAAYLRTQVTFLASNMANRMSANPYGVWKGYYNNTYPIATAPTGCIKGSACTPQDLATNDQAVWSQQLKTFLPNPVATITCQGVADVAYDPTSQLYLRPPYGGDCTMNVSWNENGAGDQTHRDSSTQTFAWEFQP